MEVFRRKNSFIFQSKLKDHKDTIGIFDLNMKPLAFCRHEHTWRTPRGPIKISKQARTTDIYLESYDGTLFGEINEIPPKLFSMRIIRKFEIYDDKKDLVGVVREKPKAVSSEWVLENFEKKTIALMVGDRKKKDYEIQSPSGKILARCYTESSLDKDSYRIDVFGNEVDLFLVLNYVIVLDLAKTAMTTRDGLIFSNTKMEKKHLLKTELLEEQQRKIQTSESSSKNSIINAFLGTIQAGLFFTLAPSFSASILLYGFGIAILVTALLGVTFFKLNQFTQVALLMGVFGLLSLLIGGILLRSASISLTFESTLLTIGIIIVGFAILANMWLELGLLDSYIKK